MRIESSDIFAASPFGIARDRPGDRRDYCYGQRRNERRRQVEERLRLAVHAVEHLRLIIAESGGGLETVHAELGVNAVEYRHDARTQRDGHAYGEYIVDYLARGVHKLVVLRRVVHIDDTCGIRRGENVIVAALVDHHVRQRHDRADGYAQHRARRADRASKPGPHRGIRDDKPGDDLEQHLQHLVHGRRDHVAVALAVSAVGGHHAHQQYRRAHRLYAQRGVWIFKVHRRQPVREEEHDEREHKPDHEERRARATRNVFSSCFARPLASASATRRDSATGRPAVASVKKMK